MNNNMSSLIHILIVNQHGENRGDEAAMRAMLNSFANHLGNVRFTLIYQFKSRYLRLKFKENVEDLPMVLPALHALGLALYSIGKILKIPIPFLLSKTTKKIISAYESSDIVISAPGGPYLGDIYYKHELVHWFFLWLAKLYKKSLVLYSTSVGPFEIPLLNIVRKHMFKKFDVLCVREEISRSFLKKLCGEDLVVHVTADSALQKSLKPYKRSEFFEGQRSSITDKFLVSVSAINYIYPGMDNVSVLQTEYNETIIKCLMHLSSKRDCHFMFFPQLYGQVHSDVPYLENLGQMFPPEVSWEILNQDFDSDMQQRLFGMTDLCIASRYHPQIFAVAAGVPGICIYYEHKALGLMSMLGLEDFAFDIRNLNPVTMCSKLDQVVEQREELSRFIKKNVVPIRKLSIKTTLLAIDLLKKTHERF